MTVNTPELSNPATSHPTSQWLPEDEIDLREYVLILGAWWREIVLLTFGLAFLAAAAVLFLREVTPPTYESSAIIAIARTQSSITFDERFTTFTPDQLQALRSSSESSARRSALVGLVYNGAVAQAVIEQLGQMLEDDELSPAYWLAADGPMKAELAGDSDNRNNSDLIRIMVRSDSPQKAAAIANVWAENYVQQVNRIYGQIPDELVASVVSELTKAQSDYDSAQRELEAFIAQNEVDKLSREIEEKTSIIASLQTGKQTAIETIVDEELQARREIISAYIAAQTNNRLLTFSKEQEAKQEMLSMLIDADTRGRLNALEQEQAANLLYFDAFVNAEVQSKLAVINEQSKFRIERLAYYYNAQAKLERLLRDAEILRAQAVQAGDASTDSNSLALLLLKAQVFAASSALPGNLTLNLGSVSDISANSQEQLTDIDALIQVLQNRLTGLELAIATQSQKLLSNEDYQFIGESGLGMVGGDDSPLAATILAQYEDLFSVGPLTQASTAISTTTPLFATLRQEYPDLFRIGDLAALTDSVADENPLAVLSAERAKELLQLQGLEDLPAYTAAAEPLTQAIDQLESEIQALQARQEAEDSRRQQLAQRRDLAWSTLTTLKNKNAELNLSAVTVNNEVRLASPAIEPIHPVVSVRLLTTVAIAGAAGLVLSVLLALFVNLMGGRPILARRESVG